MYGSLGVKPKSPGNSCNFFRKNCHLENILNVFRAIRNYAKILRLLRTKLLLLSSFSPCNKPPKKRLSSPGIFTGRVLPWIQFFFIHKFKKMRQINTTPQHGFKINFKPASYRKKSPAGSTKKCTLTKCLKHK